MLRIVKDRVPGGNKPAGGFDFLSSIQIAIKSREIAAGDLQAQGMATKKYIAG